jgi:hypothetical protein
MNTQEQARELMAQQHQQATHQQDSMRSRTEAELENSTQADALTQEQARELMAQQRQQEDHLNESMSSRAEENMKSHQ